jgi:hypothetical protein
MIHMSKKSPVCIRDSKISGAGRGVFALQGFHKGDYVCSMPIDIIIQNTNRGDVLAYTSQFAKYYLKKLLS